jgi:methyltransferase (TIGR00027 family)
MAMTPDRASRTAQHNALFRALETARPTGEHQLDDPLAASFLTGPLRLVARVGARPGLGDAIRVVIDRRWPGVRPSVVARTWLIDGTLERSVRDGAEQVVLLGAGYDARAYRLACLHHLTVFEVDHPTTQAAKRAALARTLPVQPPNVRFVATDFNLDGLDAAMRAAGFDDRRATSFVWEGVTNYLDASAVDATFRWMAGAGPGSEAIFTYIDREVLDHPERYAGSARLRASLSRVGEPLTWGLPPATTAAYLDARGLRLRDDLGAADYRRLYYGHKAAQIVGHEFYRVAIAAIGARTATPGVTSVVV